MCYKGHMPLEDMLYDLDGWQNIRKTYEVVNYTFCIRVEAGYTGANAVMVASRNRSSENHGPRMRQRRFIQPDLLGLEGQEVNDPNRDIPALSTILRVIQRRNLSLQYARWDRYQGSVPQGINPGPMLELAYWIGPTPGVWDENIDRQFNLGQYRDRRAWGRTRPNVRDRWVVLHSHFDERRQVFFEMGRRTYAGFTSITAYHAHRAVDRQIIPNTDTWRVDFRGANGGAGNTARLIIHCPYDDSERSSAGRVITRMFAGYDLDGTRPWHGEWDFAWPGLLDLRLVVRNLVLEGYLNTPGYIPIVNWGVGQQLNVHGEMPAGMYPNPPFQPATTGQRHGPPNIYNYPYGTNFRITNFRITNFQQGNGQSSNDWEYNFPMPSQWPQDVANNPVPAWRPPPPPPGPPPPPSPPGSFGTMNGTSNESYFDLSLLKNLTLEEH